MDARFVHAAVISWAPDLRLTHAEGNCHAILGIPCAQLEGRSLSEVFHITEARARELDALSHGAEPVVEFVQANLGDDPRVSYRFQIGRDERGATAGVMNLQQLLQGAPPVQISKLSSSLSHEIRNPLSSVKMAVQTLARNTTLGDRDKRRLTIANREIRTMERMLWLLSEYGRDSAPHLDRLSLRALVQDSAAIVALELGERRVEVSIDEEEGLPLVQVDAGRLRPVLAQLLLNVAMGQPEDSKVQVTLGRAEGGRLKLVLVDPAGAMPEGNESLFEPFGSHLARGAGLSLAALRRVLLNQGGEITVVGSAGPGLVFTLLFAC